MKIKSPFVVIMWLLTLFIVVSSHMLILAQIELGLAVLVIICYNVEEWN